MKFRNKNFPSNDTYFGEPTEHLYLHHMLYDLDLGGGVGFAYINIFCDRATPLINLNEDENRKEFIKILNQNNDEIYNVGGLLEGNKIPIFLRYSEANDTILLRYCLVNDGSWYELIMDLEYLNTARITQIY